MAIEQKTAKDKLKELKELQKKVNKTFGENALMTGKEAIDSGALDKVIVSTPSIELNQALYCGGLGGIVELFGPPSSGKTSLAIETLAKAQKEDPNYFAVWLETEHSIFPEILNQHGVDVNRVIYIPQENFGNAENALDVIIAAIQTGNINLCIVNSIAGLCPKVETEDDLTKQNIALTARVMSKFFRKVTGIAGKTKTNMIFINQVRDNVGVMFGDPTTTTGGRALGFYANQRVRMNVNKIQKEDPITADQGVKISCIIYKNRYAGMHNPNTKCVYYAMFDSGIDSIIAIPNMLLDKGIFIKNGAWWYYPNKENVQTIAGVECKFNSQNALIDTLRNNEKFLEEIRKMINVESVSSEEKLLIDKDEQDIVNFVSDVDNE